jgi:16S rRNA (uracil1498-N3)-methyltransferase
MQVFYAPDITGDVYTLGEKESRHCVRVLRMTTGSRIRLIDGKGSLYEAVITSPDPGRCSLSITGVTRDFETRNYRLHLAISPLKNYERFEWFIEKSVEIGVDEITPLLCDNTEKPGVKRERVSSLIISAMKQSLKSKLTVLNEPVSFADFVKADHEGTRMIAHCSTDSVRSRIGDVCRKGENATLLIGPEGDFSPKEIREAVEAGFAPVHLGNSRLRSETAGIAACCTIYYINQ